MKFGRFYYNFKYGIHFRKHELVYRTIKNMLAVHLGKATPLRYLDACVTLDCNLHCEHCFAEDFKNGSNPLLSPDEWQDVVEQCYKLGNLAVGFTGGEPLMRPDLEELIARCRPRQTLIIVCTNGHLLTPERARSLYAAGVDCVQVSIESMDPDTHNQFRRTDDGHRQTMQAIENAIAAGIKPTIVPCVSHMNVHSKGFLDLLAWSHKKGLMTNLALATPTGSWNGRTDVLLTQEDADFIDKLVARYPNVRRDFETNYAKNGCGAATEKLYITAHGDVLCCPYMHISFGNVRELDVASIRRNMLSVRKLQGYYPRCLMAEDLEFMEGPLARTFNKKVKPVDWKEVFDANDRE